MKIPEDAREKLRELEEYRKRTDETLDAMTSRAGEVRYAEIGEHEEAMRDYYDAFDDVAEWLIALGVEALDVRADV